MPKSVAEQTAEWKAQAKRDDRTLYAGIVGYLIVGAAAFFWPTTPDDRWFAWVWVGMGLLMLILHVRGRRRRRGSGRSRATLT